MGMSFASSAQLKLVETPGFEIEPEVVVVCEGLEMIMAVVFVKTCRWGLLDLCGLSLYRLLRLWVQ